MLKAFATLDVSTHLFKVHFTMKLTYRTLPYDDDDNDVDIQGADADITESGGTPSGDTRNKAQWDDDCPWSEWYSAEDPIKGKLIYDFFTMLSFPVWCCYTSFGVWNTLGMMSKSSLLFSKHKNCPFMGAILCHKVTLPFNMAVQASYLIWTPFFFFLFIIYYWSWVPDNI